MLEIHIGHSNRTRYSEVLLNMPATSIPRTYVIGKNNMFFSSYSTPEALYLSYLHEQLIILVRTNYFGATTSYQVLRRLCQPVRTYIPGISKPIAAYHPHNARLNRDTAACTDIRQELIFTAKMNYATAVQLMKAVPPTAVLLLYIHMSVSKTAPVMKFRNFRSFTKP